MIPAKRLVWIRDLEVYLLRAYVVIDIIHTLFVPAIRDVIHTAHQMGL
jgi:hypothetical protein